MPLTLVRSADESLVSPETLRRLRAALAREGRATLLVASFSQALDAQRALAEAGGLSLGVTVITPGAWAAERWEVWGDGRRMVDGASRSVLSARVMARAADPSGPLGAQGPGTAELLAELVRQGLPWLVGAPSCAGVTDAERALVGLADEYARELEAHGLVEPVSVEVVLPALLDEAGAEVAPIVCVGLEGLPRAGRELVAGLAARHEVTVVARCQGGPADARAEALLSQLAELAVARGARVGECVEPAAGAPARAPGLCALAGGLFRGDAALRPSGAVRLLLPAGPSSRAELVAREVVSLVGEGCAEVVVSAPDAAAAWRELSPRLVARGVSCRAQLSCEVGSLECGRAFLEYLRAVARLVELDASWPEPVPVPGAPRRKTVRVRLGDMSWWPPRELSDFLLSEISHTDAARARALDARWRANRLLTPAAVLSQLTSERDVSPEVAAATRELVRGRVGAAASRLLGPLARSGAEGGPADPEAAAVLAAALDVAGSLRALGVCADPAVPGHVGLSDLVAQVDAVLSGTRVPLRLERAVPGSSGRVLVVAPAAAARLAPGSADALVSLGQSVEESPVHPADDILSALLVAYGVEEAPRPVDELRAQFASVVRVARRTLVLERPLFGADGKDCHPSVMLTELLACYGLSADAAPQELAAALGETCVLTRSEMPVGENASSTGAAPSLVLSERPAPAGRIDAHERACVSPPPEGVRAEQDRPLLSASQIETYLECPYKWFSLRRLRLSDADALFSGAETGTFAHRVLELTRAELIARAVERACGQDGLARARAQHPEAMQEEPYRERVAELVGRAQVSPEERLPGSSPRTSAQIAEAREVLDEEFDTHLSHQYQLVGARPMPQALVAHSAQEHGSLHAFRRDLSSLLDYESTMLCGFEPRFLEWRFGRGGEGVDYAGVRLTGTVDRIDVDAHGQAVVIDYKHKSDSSFAREYDALPEDGFDPAALFAPRRVQSLIYAQVVRRAFPGLSVRAAVYLCTRGGHALAGAVDENLVDVVFGDRPPKTQRRGRVSVPRSASFAQPDARGMEALLDGCEQVVADAVSRMLDGDIEAAPADVAACQFCPVLNCERRLHP